MWFSGVIILCSIIIDRKISWKWIGSKIGRNQTRLRIFRVAILCSIFYHRKISWKGSGSKIGIWIFRVMILCSDFNFLWSENLVKMKRVITVNVDLTALHETSTVKSRKNNLIENIVKLKRDVKRKIDSLNLPFFALSSLFTVFGLSKIKILNSSRILTLSNCSIYWDNLVSSVSAEKRNRAIFFRASQKNQIQKLK